MSTPIYDYDNAQLRQISNDAYFYFKTGEEPLDDINLEEIEELKEEFPLGFQLLDDYELVEDTDLVEVMLVPVLEIEKEEDTPEYKESSEYDMALELFNGWEVRYKEISAREVHAFYFHPVKGPWREGNYPLETTKNGDKYIAMGKSIYPLKRFTPF